VLTWCSTSCRHRTGSSHGPESGRAAVEVVDRSVGVDKPLPLVGQVLVSPHGRAWPQTLADLVAEPGSAALADALGQALTALDRRPAWRPHHGGNGSSCLPGRDTVPDIRVVPVLVNAQSAISPQKVRKTSINVDHQWTPSETICAGQRAYGAKCAGHKDARIAFTPRLSSVRARPGPRT
jgi:hypothetical protein